MPLLSSHTHPDVPEIITKVPRRSISERISRIQARLENILSQKPNKKKQNEIESIDHSLSELFMQASIEEKADIGRVQLIANSARTYIETVSATDILTMQRGFPEIQEVQSINLSVKNLYAIGYIDHLLTIFNHGLSSTKSKGYKTYGDGSFINLIFRPILQVLKNQILTNPKIDAGNISWEDIYHEYNKQVTDLKVSRNRFIGLLENYKKKGDFSDIFGVELLNIVTEFSQSHFYRNNKKMALQNVLDALQNNTPLGFIVPKKYLSEIK